MLYPDNVNYTCDEDEMLHDLLIESHIITDDGLLVIDDPLTMAIAELVLPDIF